MPKPYQVQDPYFKKAKEKGYRARSAFKLLEIQEKFKIIKPGDHVLDLGSAPGSWLQVVSEIVGPKGSIVGVDLEPIEPIKNVQMVQGDISSDETFQKIYTLHPTAYSLVLSDLAPKTSGVKDVDQYRSIELNEHVLRLCHTFLKRGGNVVMKVFVGGDFQPFQKKVQELFATVKQFKPQATRDRSFEVYLIGKGFR